MEVDGLGVEEGLVRVEVGDEFLEPPVELELGGPGGGEALVREHDADALVEEGQLPEAVREDIKGIDGLVEDGGVGLEADGRAPPVARASHGHGGVGNPGVVHLEPALAVQVDMGLAPGGKGIDDGDADAMESARDLVGSLVELASRMELGHDQLQGRDAFLGMYAHGDAAAIVLDPDYVVFLENHHDVGAVAGQGLIDGVVHDLIDEVVEPIDSG
jgi:hypothetical protein